MDDYVDSLEAALIDLCFDLDPQEISNRSGLSLQRCEEIHKVYFKALKKYESKYDIDLSHKSKYPWY